ncbi:hypothetical protein [Ruegeria marina]|uniref:Uncharacterized protein n=1 Tax=Ruegeria marina TaxID=639004 RepID=A0A1G6LHG4_9RHOB|nr:hypothetical protein [Ruegeria marina]SDC42644.1 hypothetical protein SAMN04488239_102243 [Ruegeria marina]
MPQEYKTAIIGLLGVGAFDGLSLLKEEGLISAKDFELLAPILGDEMRKVGEVLHKAIIDKNGVQYSKDKSKEMRSQTADMTRSQRQFADAIMRAAGVKR